MSSAWQPPPPPRSQSSGVPKWAWFAFGCAGLCVLGPALMCGGLLLMTGGNEGGVRYANDMEDYAAEYVRQHGLLAPGEQIVAYYDATLDLDATEAAILTDQRLLYHRTGNTTAILLADIADVYVTDDPLLGDLIDVTGSDGSLMHIEIAPLNGGDGFVRALEDQRSIAQGGAPFGGFVQPSSFGYGAPGAGGL